MEHAEYFKLKDFFTTTTITPINITQEGLITMNQREYLDLLHPDPTSTEVALSYVKFFMCAFGTLVNLLIIYIIIILRCKKMNRPVNIYILNWLICNGLFIMVDPSDYQIYAYLWNYKSDTEVICFMVSYIVILATIDIMFMLILMLYWVCDVRKSMLFERHGHKIVAGVWIFALLEFLIISSHCLIRNMYGHMGEIYLQFLTLTFVVCFTIIHCLRYCANPFAATCSLPLALVTSFVLCWATMIANAILYHFTNNWISLILSHIGKIIVYLYPLVVFYLFYRSDSNFAFHTRILFRMQRCESDAADNNRSEEAQDGGSNNNSDVELN